VNRVHVFCEGQTEETFVKELMFDHFVTFGVFINPILVRTSRQGKGGVNTYAKIREQILRKCKEDTSSYVTMMIDFYRIPPDTPGQILMEKEFNPYRKVVSIEKAIGDDIGQPNFIPNVLLHEFEGLLFSDLEPFKDWFDEREVNSLFEESRDFESPEHVDDGMQTAPSKRILKNCASYDKIIHGTLIALEIGLDAIRGKCKHFDSWVSKLEHLG